MGFEYYRRKLTQLLPTDQIVVKQNGRDKWFSATNLVEDIKGLVVEGIATNPVPPHTHTIGDITDTFVNAVGVTPSIPPVTVNGVFAGLFSVTVPILAVSGVIHLTRDGLSTGTAIFPNGVITDSVQLQTIPHVSITSLVWSNSNKTLTFSTGVNLTEVRVTMMAWGS